MGGKVPMGADIVVQSREKCRVWPSVGRVVFINGSPSEAVHAVPSSRVERGLAGSRISGHRSGGCNIEDAARPGSDVTVVLQVEG